MTQHSATAGEPLDLSRMREQLVERIWLAWLLVALLGWPTSMVRIWSTGWQPVFAMHTGLALGMIGLYLARRRLGIGFKITTAIALPFLIGIPALLNLGFYSAGLLWMVIGCLVAALFLRRRQVVVILIAEALFLSAVAWAFVTGHLVVPVDGNTYIQRADAWFGLLVGTLTASVAVILAVQQYNRSLTELIATVTEQRDLIYHHAMHDALTGLASLRLARDRLQQACARASRSHGRVALLFIDLDRFKDVNDRFGHDAGDAVLKAVGRRLQAALRGIDTAARIGGDEFLVIMADVETDEGVLALVERLRVSLAEPVLHDGRSHSVGASIGIARFPDDAATPEQLLSRADRAMYRIKADSRRDRTEDAGSRAGPWQPGA